MPEELPLLEPVVPAPQAVYERRALHEVEAAGVAVAVGSEPSEVVADAPGVAHRVLRRLHEGALAVHASVVPLAR